VWSLSFCPSPFSGTTNDDDNDGRTDGRRKVSTIIFTFLLLATFFYRRNLAKFGEIKRESKKIKNEVILEAFNGGN
jgi:hypothetical protein